MNSTLFYFTLWCAVCAVITLVVCIATRQSLRDTAGYMVFSFILVPIIAFWLLLSWLKGTLWR